MTSTEMVVVGMKHIVCFSGGHSSAIAAVEVVRKFGAEDTILLNHDLCPRTEDADIKRFKNEVANFLGVPITYANMPGWEDKDQFDVCMEIRAFKAGAQSTAFCTNRLKTEPFHKWLAENYLPLSEMISFWFTVLMPTSSTVSSAVSALWPLWGIGLNIL